MCDRKRVTRGSLTIARSEKGVLLNAHFKTESCYVTVTYPMSSDECNPVGHAAL